MWTAVQVDGGEGRVVHQFRQVNPYLFHFRRPTAILQSGTSRVRRLVRHSGRGASHRRLQVCKQQCAATDSSLQPTLVMVRAGGYQQLIAKAAWCVRRIGGSDRRSLHLDRQFLQRHHPRRVRGSLKGNKGLQQGHPKVGQSHAVIRVATRVNHYPHA